MARRYIGQMDLAELNDAVHSLHQELLLDTIESITALDLSAAGAVWHRFRAGLRAHATFEDDVVLPIYARIGQFPRGASLAILEGEHRTLFELIEVCSGALEALRADVPRARRRMVLALPRFFRLEGVLEHHTIRERELVYPTLASTAPVDETRRIREVLEAQLAEQRGDELHK